MLFAGLLVVIALRMTVPGVRPTRKPMHKPRAGIAAYLLAALFVIAAVFPFALDADFIDQGRSKTCFTVPPHWLPTSPTLANYVKVLLRFEIFRATF